MKYEQAFNLKPNTGGVFDIQKFKEQDFGLYPSSVTPASVFRYHRFIQVCFIILLNLPHPHYS